MTIAINSLITKLYAAHAPLSGQPPVKNPAAQAEPGVVFSRQEPWRNQAGNATASGYTRKDALGRGSNPPPTLSATETKSGQAAESAATPNQTPETPQEQTAPDAVKKPNGELLSKPEMALLRELQKADQAVKAHEMAHLAAAGGYAKGGASFSYQRGPDGQNYAVGGEVQVDTGKEATPEATIQKMQVVRQAALAPVDPSPQDQQVAAHATLQISESSKELLLAQSRQSQQPAALVAATKETEGTARGIYQPIGQELGLRAASPPGAQPKKNYGLYLKAIPPPVSSDRQSLDRIA